MQPISKLRLDLDELSVESFEASDEQESRGTVLGHAQSQTTCYQLLCDCSYNYEDSCAGSCGCNGSGTGGSGGTGGTQQVTCATGFQIICECW